MRFHIVGHDSSVLFASHSSEPSTTDLPGALAEGWKIYYVTRRDATGILIDLLRIAQNHCEPKTRDLNYWYL